MANRNPLFSYDSLRTVMTYLDPLVRLKLSRQCSSLRYLHNNVPLKIQYLRITRSGFEVNGTEYKIDIIKQYHHRENPKVVVKKRKVAPSFCAQLLIIPEKGSRKIEYLEYRNPLQQIKNDVMLKLLGANTQIHVKSMEVAGALEAEAILEPVELRRFFEPEFFHKAPCFPFETKRLKVSSLTTSCGLSETLNTIRPALDGSPLKMIEVYNFVTIPDDPIIQSAEFLHIIGNSQLEVLMRFANERIHLGECSFTVQNVEDLVAHWKNTEAAIGKHFSMGFKEVKDVKEFLNIFRGLPGAKSRVLKETSSTPFPECVILPIGDHSELHVYCETSKPQDTEYCKTEWIVRIKIQDKGFADNVFID